MINKEEKKKELDQRVKEIGELKKEFLSKVNDELFEVAASLHKEITQQQQMLMEFLLSIDTDSSDK